MMPHNLQILTITIWNQESTWEICESAIKLEYWLGGLFGIESKDVTPFLTCLKKEVHTKIVDFNKLLNLKKLY